MSTKEGQSRDVSAATGTAAGAASVAMKKRRNFFWSIEGLLKFVETILEGVLMVLNSQIGSYPLYLCLAIGWGITTLHACVSLATHSIRGQVNRPRLEFYFNVVFSVVAFSLAIAQLCGYDWSKPAVIAFAIRLLHCFKSFRSYSGEYPWGENFLSCCCGDGGPFAGTKYVILGDNNSGGNGYDLVEFQALSEEEKAKVLATARRSP